LRLRQIVGALFIIGWNIVWTSLILLFIKFVLRVPLRMSEADLLIGDDAIHGVSNTISIFFLLTSHLLDLFDANRKKPIVSMRSS
jgi:ammonia channel protein AmtB